MNRKIKDNLISHFLLFALIGVILIFYIVEPLFLNMTNIMDILRTSSVVGIMAIGGMLAMAIGEINFATGAQAMVCAAIMGSLMDGHIKSYLLALLITLLVAAFSSLVEAIVVVDIGVPSFISTLGVAMMLKGLTRYFAGGNSFTSSRWPKSFGFLGQTNILGVIPVPVIVFLICCIIGYILTERVRFGRYIFAIGANSTACANVGINVRLIKYAAFIISGILSGFSGVVYASINNVVSLTIADNLLTPSLCAIVLGATYKKIGFYNIEGTILASVMLILIQNGVMSIGAQFYVKDIIQGIILLISVGIIAKTRKEGLPKVSFENS